MFPVCDPFILRFDPPLGGGDGPLSGLTVGVKDNFDVAGAVTGNGAPEWGAAHGPAATTAPLVERLMALGGALLGKTHMDELAYSLMGLNARYGAPLNAAAPDRAPGGSSSGSAAAVAAGLCDVGLGSDTGGSVRLPASFCGVWGWRATHGSLPDGGLAPLAPSYDVPGFFTRDASTLARVAGALLPARGDDLPPAFWAPADAWAKAEPATVAALRPVVDALADRFGPVDRAPLPEAPLDDWLPAFRVHQGREIWRALGPWIEARRPDFGPGIKERFAMASGLTDVDFAAAAAKRARIRAALDAAMAPRTVLLLPTSPGPAPLRDADQAGLEAFRNAALTLLCVAGHCGLPQVTAPVATVDGAPVGLSLVGERGSDRRLIALAAEALG